MTNNYVNDGVAWIRRLDAIGMHGCEKPEKSDWLEERSMHGVRVSMMWAGWTDRWLDRQTYGGDQQKRHKTEVLGKIIFDLLRFQIRRRFVAMDSKFVVTTLRLKNSGLLISMSLSTPGIIPATTWQTSTINKFESNTKELDPQRLLLVLCLVILAAVTFSRRQTTSFDLHPLEAVK